MRGAVIIAWTSSGKNPVGCKRPLGYLTYLPRGRQPMTQDAAGYIMKLPPVAKQKLELWQTEQKRSSWPRKLPDR